MAKKMFPVLGCGVGLRNVHYPVITKEWPKMDWFEAISENYMDTGGRPLHILEQVRQHYPIALHGTALSIGSVDPISQNYLVRLKTLIERIDPFIVSDHLCWSGVQGETLHDLLPLPFTEEALQHIVRRVDYVQNFLGRRILLENVSSYITYRHSTMPEWEFITEVAKRSGCGILIDLNNIYVNAFNHKFDPLEYIDYVPGELVGQLHLAGHTDMGTFLFDTHSAEVIRPVWDLYREALKRWGRISTLIEWDEHIPEYFRLAQEAERARQIYLSFSESYPDKPFNRRPERNERAQNQIFRFAQDDKTDFLSGGKIPSLKEVELWLKSRIVLHEKECLPKISEVKLNPQGGGPGEDRLSVYAGGYVARIHESLKEVYETIHHIFGEEVFSELSEGYAKRYSSHHYNLNFAGCHFPEYLECLPVTQKYPFLPDLAKLEWLISQAFHAFDKSALDTAKLESLSLEDWDRARLIFQPSVAVLRSQWPVLDLWQMRERPREEFPVKVEARPVRILVGRRGLQVRCELLKETQCRLIERLLAGETLGEALEELTGHDSDEIPPVSQWFSRWVKDGLIAHCEIHSYQNS